MNVVERVLVWILQPIIFGLRIANDGVKDGCKNKKIKIALGTLCMFYPAFLFPVIAAFVPMQMSWVVLVFNFFVFFLLGIYPGLLSFAFLWGLFSFWLCVFVLLFRSVFVGIF
jgi:hypothetical protein